MGGCWSRSLLTLPAADTQNTSPAASSSTRPGSPGAELMVPEGLGEQLLPPSPPPNYCVFGTSCLPGCRPHRLLAPILSPSPGSCPGSTHELFQSVPKRKGSQEPCPKPCQPFLLRPKAAAARLCAPPLAHMPAAWGGPTSTQKCARAGMRAFGCPHKGVWLVSFILTSPDALRSSTGPGAPLRRGAQRSGISLGSGLRHPSAELCTQV